jgi:hypothetical protein
MKKALLLLGVAALLLFALSGVALAATSQDIYDDYADNGKLDGTYTSAELQAYLDDATIHQYGDPKVVDDLDQLVTALLARDSFPFTGFQLGLMAAAAVALIGGGFVLRRATRRRG